MLWKCNALATVNWTHAITSYTSKTGCYLCRRPNNSKRRPRRRNKSRVGIKQDLLLLIIGTHRKARIAATSFRSLQNTKCTLLEYCSWAACSHLHIACSLDLNICNIALQAIPIVILDRQQLVLTIAVAQSTRPNQKWNVAYAYYSIYHLPLSCVVEF